jgi:hypothetical protein
MIMREKYDLRRSFVHKKRKKNNANFNDKVLIALLSMKSWGIFFFLN